MKFLRNDFFRLFRKRGRYIHSDLYDNDKSRVSFSVVANWKKMDFRNILFADR